MTANRRMTLTVAFACALSSIVLYPLFTSSGWFYVGLGAIITVAASGALSRLRTLPGVVLLAVGGIGITAILTDLIAVRLRSTALAGLPLLVLFTVPITMNAQHENL